MTSPQRLTVRNPDARRLANELAQITGESMTTAVIRALEMRLDAVRRTRNPKVTAERILKFAARFSQSVGPGLSSSGHATLLYDDTGLPK